MDSREECTYKEKCYRKKYEHFERFKHSHLEELLGRIGIHEIHVPFGYIPSVSFSTLKQQLEIERKIKSKLVSDEPSSKKPKVNSENDVISLLNCDNDVFEEKTSQPVDSLETEVATIAESILSNSSRNETNQNSNCNENSVIPETSSSTSPLPGTSSPLKFPTASSSSSQNSSQTGKKSFEKQRVSADRHSNNMKQAEAFKKLVQSQIHLNIKDKLRAVAPYNILYTTLTSLPDSPPDRLALTFSELLDSPLGLLENSLLINFMVQFGWILACYFTMGHGTKPMTLLYGEIDTELGTKFEHFLKHTKVKPPSSFGSHHTKMMIFQYLDKSIRVVICTANLVESDWVNRTQGVWISDKCEEMDPTETGGDSITHFKRDLLIYLRSYNLNVLQPWIEKVEKADMSHIKAFFIASIPGTHKMVEGQWGQARLRNVLRQHAPVVENNSYKVIAQISSIGSLGATPNSWLMGDILTTMSMTKPSSLQSQPSLSVIYPSFSDVESSIDGLLGGGCLPYSSNTHRRQEWLSNYLHHWKSDKIGRTRAVPHIKSYTRVSSDYSRISYFLLTSANLSKAAWGTISKSQTLNILSYEAGILLLPEFLFGDKSEYFPLSEETSVDEEHRKPVFSLPYDLPLTPYSNNDTPWFIDTVMID